MNYIGICQSDSEVYAIFSRTTHVALSRSIFSGILRLCSSEDITVKVGMETHRHTQTDVAYIFYLLKMSGTEKQRKIK